MTKQAYADIAGDLLADCISIMEDAGLTVVGSAQGPHHGTVRLLIEGDRLPAVCAGEKLHGVNLMVSMETYGKQRIKRIAAINVLPEPNPIARPWAHAYHAPLRTSGPEDPARLAGC